MNNLRPFVDYLLNQPVPLAGVLAIVVAAIELAIDWLTWVELDVSVVYVVPLVLAAVARNRRLLWGLLITLVFMTFAAYATQIAPGAFSLDEPFFINRVLSAVALLISATLCNIWITAADRLAKQQLSLIEQNGELDRLRKAAEQANGRKTQLLASISHDIRTPLSAMDLTAQALIRSAGDPKLSAQLPQLADRLRRTIRSLVDFLSALVDISSLDAGKVGLSVSEFSLNELLAEQHERFLPLTQAKGLRLETRGPEKSVELKTDRIKLMRVLNNLLGNAIKFTQAGSVTVAASLSPEAELVICVKDTGVGISADNLPRVFDEYGQLGNPERDSNKGWGLGLSICHRLVNVMGGRIAVESEPNHGTTFTITLPASCISRSGA